MGRFLPAVVAVDSGLGRLDRFDGNDSRADPAGDGLEAVAQDLQGITGGRLKIVRLSGQSWPEGNGNVEDRDATEE